MDLKHSTTNNIPHPHHESETPPHSPTINLISFPNGKTNHHHHHHKSTVTYRECLKNHAAGIGGHALDGCGEFMASPTYTPSSYQCAACGCHRNFHRREPITCRTNFIDFHRPSPPDEPTSFAYGRHLVLSLSTASDQNKTTVATPGTPMAMKMSSGKRFRTKFSSDQKEKMLCFAEKVGWKMQRCEDKMIADFCNDIGIKRGVFKVWMHNNKNTATLAKRSSSVDHINKNTTAVAVAVAGRSSSDDQEHGSSSSS